MSNSSTGLQSCLDPLLLQPRLLIQSIPWLQKQPEIPIDKMCKNIGQESQVYEHPLVKRSSSSLSTRSLEMCTESLGSETGTNIDEFSYQQPEKPSFREMKTGEFAKKVKHSRTFPPPLSSISGSDGVQVQTHREGGRLVIKAFSYSCFSSYFQAERENGRLRLSLMKDGYGGSEKELTVNEDEEEEEENRNGNNLERDREEIDEDKDKDEEEDYEGSFEGVIGGGEWSSSSRWCNGDMSSRKRLPSLPICVAIS